MPILILFQHGALLTISIINRRLHKRDARRDVLEKVTLIKDIRAAEPHRAHLEILYDLSLPVLAAAHPVGSFGELQRAWATVLSSAELNKRFYREIASWYFWATQQVTFPAGVEPDAAKRNDVAIIRLITRMIFVWFLKEKGLVPAALFNPHKLEQMLTDLAHPASSYYKAILQNLFFATLNQEMDKRGFRSKASPGGRDGNRLVTNRYRYQDYFRPGGDQQLLELLSTVPFLNGGLFECLDTEDEQRQPIRIDGFSDESKNPLVVPNQLFFGAWLEVHLPRLDGTGGGMRRVRGLIHILSHYKFTVVENTPIEEEIALDPELLGQVFENLLAAYNPETGETARKETGSFYTPREVVSYMVDESLLAYLETALLAQGPPTSADLTDRLRHLLAYNAEEPLFDSAQRQQLIAAIDRAKILDPACGSGAFPIGVLQKLVFLLGKLDPHNTGWKQRQLANIAQDQATARQLQDEHAQELALGALEQKHADLERAFAYDELDYARKLYLIQSCIYGVDIQPIAVQIAKLRCFIALIVEQQTDESLPNRGVLALPNLETRFVAANALLGAGVQQNALRSQQVIRLEEELAVVRQRHFEARTPTTKRKYRAEDQRIRRQIGGELKRDGIPGATADRLAQWDPYDQNATADFFDPVWMFGVHASFDIVIANPPYVRQERIKEQKPALQEAYPEVATGTADLYVYFYARSLQLLRTGGVLTFISSNKYFRAGYGKKLRQHLAAHTRIHSIIDFGDAPVFTAIAYPSIIITRKAAPDGATVRALTWEPGPPVSEFARIFLQSSIALDQKELRADGWRLESPAVLRLLDKLRAAGTPLGEYVQGRFYYGIKTGLNEAFVVDHATHDALIAAHPSSAELLKPFLRGRDVKRWAVHDPKLWLILSRRGINITQYPAIYEHLKQFKQRLELKAGNNAWYELQASPGDVERFEQPKIIYPDIYEHQSFAFDDQSFYCVNTCYFIPTTEPWLCGLLNSQIIEWYYSQVSNRIRGGYLRSFNTYMELIPIPDAPAAEREAIATLAQQCIKAGGQGAQVAAWEAEIDERVARLYGLTAAELAAVRGGG
ncbi:MAG: N-6 DNA methylase [Chloroflexaceae bacterium]|nr:N-6 DNA methylase [Chloroflexaceae bacterium]